MRCSVSTNRIVLATAFATVLLLSSGAGQGVLRGVVVDSLDTSPLYGANVFLTGTALGAATDRDGSFWIPNIPVGSYDVRISYIGYKTKVLTVRIGLEASVLDVALSPDVVEMEEVLVTAQIKGQVAAINQQITSNTIVNIVSEERIQELPDVNAAEAIGRLPGVSLIRSGGEANKVILRGLADKFSTVTIDGIKIPPTDADQRGVDLSMISQGSLAGVELYKALTPDKDADAIAGNINLVTRRAPSERLMRADVRGVYSHLMRAYDQYAVELRYGERFFDDVLGVQATGNLERRNRSNERYNLDWNQGLSGGMDYEISNLLLEFTDEIRSRGGFGILLDVNTPENGFFKANAIYSNTQRDYLFSTRNYPTSSGGLVQYSARDREQEFNTFNGSVQGDNRIFGLSLLWGLSFAQSLADYPYDYALDFIEPSIFQSGVQVSGMRPIGSPIKDNPQQLIPYALNNYQLAYPEWAYFRKERNLDKERTAFLNVGKEFSVGSGIAGELKAGWKYKDKGRKKNSSTLFTPYYLGYWREYTRLADGSLVPKNFAGTSFEEFMARFQASGGTARTPFTSDFLDPDPLYRNLYNRYTLTPIVNRNKLREWYELNKNGVDILGRNPEYYTDPAVAADYYDIIERVHAGYVMGTLNLDQTVTLIAGLRVEAEDNDYASRYSPTSLSGFPVSGTIKDTTAYHAETNWLPHAHLTIRPTEFMNVRLAAYRALARPDFNLRLEKYIVQGGGGEVSLLLGNPDLKTSKAWNYELNTSFFSNTIGLISISGFYKEITDMVHVLSDASVSGDELIKSLGIGWNSPFPGGTTYGLTVPYNSPTPTKVWGLEFEHQMNFSFLTGFFKNIVLSYNGSIVQSETYLISTSIETTYVVPVPGFPPVPIYSSVVGQSKQKLEGQPEFYGNISLGYDIGGFSVRVSLYHQGEFNSTFSASSLTDQIINGYTRWDLVLKQELTEKISVRMNISNLTDTEDRNTIYNRIRGWKLLNTSEHYGMTIDLGLRVEL